MGTGLQDLLLRHGVPAELAALLATRVAALPDDALLRLGGRPEEEMRLLRACVVAAQETALMEGALPPLLASLDDADLPDRPRGVLRHLTGVLRWRRDSDVGGALEALNESVVLCESGADDVLPAYAGRVHDTLGQLLHHRGQPADARAAYERALESKRLAGDAAGMALTHGNLGRLCLEGGDFAAAAEHLTQDLAYVTEHEPERTRVRGQLETELGLCFTELGETEAARAHLDRATALARAHGDDVGRAFAAVYAGRLALQEDRRDAVVERLAAARDAIERLGPGVMPELPALVEELAAELALREGKHDVALQALGRADDHVARAGRLSPIERARFLASWARALRATGDHEGAVARLRQALRALDAATGTEGRCVIEQELKELDPGAWLLHGAGRFVGHDLIERLLQEGGEEGFRGREEEMTVLFSDIRGFTSVAESLAPDDLIDLLNRYLESMTRCVQHHDGHVDKFIGDAVMALFRSSDGERDARRGVGPADRAVAAARYMRAELERFNRDLPDGIPPLGSGVGLHAGRVVAGVIGSPQKRSFTVIGDAVNTASRLEGMTKALDASILLSDAVRDRLLAPDRWILLPLGAWRPKGRRRAVEVHALVGGRGGGAAARAALRRAEAAAAALDLFRNRAFDEAAAALTALADEGRPGEGVAAFRRRAEAARHYAQAPPPPDWDGAIELLEK